MTETRSVVRGGVLSAGAMLCTMVAMLVVGKVLTYSLTKPQVAVFSLILIAGDFLNTANNFGFSTSMPKLLGAADAGKRLPLLRILLRFQRSITFGLAAIILIIWASFDTAPRWITHPTWRWAYHYLWLLALLFTVGTFRDTLLAAFAGLNRYVSRAAAQISGAVLHALLIVVFIGLLNGEITTLGLCTFSAHALTVTILLVCLPRHHERTDDALQLRDALRFSRPLHANSCLHFMFQRFDTFLISLLFADLGAIAVYEFTKRVPLMFSRTLGALLVPFLPTIAKHAAANESDRAASFLMRAYALMSFIGYSGVLMLVLLRETIILVLFTPEYLDGAPVLGILTIAICLTVQAGMMGQTLIALGQPKWVIRSNLCMAVVSIAANIVLIPRYGIEGAAWSAVAAAAFSNAAQTFFVKRNGIRIRLLAYLKPHILLVIAGAVLLLGDGIPYRLGALAVFIAGAFLTQLVTPSSLWSIAVHLLPKARETK